MLYRHALCKGHVATVHPLVAVAEVLVVRSTVSIRRVHAVVVIVGACSHILKGSQDEGEGEDEDEDQGQGKVEGKGERWSEGRSGKGFLSVGA